MLQVTTKESDMKPVDELTQQEIIVLALLAKGWRNAKIAQELVISTRTVETHVYRILDKLGMSSRTEAALYAVHSGLVSIYK
jgi:two-component system, NarL family, response regulator LiaR